MKKAYEAAEVALIVLEKMDILTGSNDTEDQENPF